MRKSGCTSRLLKQVFDGNLDVGIVEDSGESFREKEGDEEHHL